MFRQNPCSEAHWRAGFGLYFGIEHNIPYAQIRPGDFAVFFNFFQIFFRGRNGNGEVDILRAEHHGGVDADRFAFQIKQGTARVAEVDGGVRLDEAAQVVRTFFINRSGDQKARKTGNDAFGNGVLELRERVADGDDRLPQLQPERVANGNSGQVLRFYF